MRCSSTSSSLFLLSSSSSSSALRCSPFMAKLPCQAGLQNHPGFLFPSSSSSSSSAFRTFRMAALSAHSMVPCGGGGGGGGGRLGDESKCASVLLNSRLKPGFLNSAIRSPGNALSYYWPLSASMAWSSVDYGVFSTRRHFSQVSGETKEEESVGGFTKHDKKKKKKKSKPLAASRAESGVTDSSSTSANSEKVDHATNNSNVNSTKRKQSKSKKSAEQTSKSIASKGGQSPKKEKTSTGNAIEEVSDNSAPTTTQSKKKSGRSSKKEKSVKRDNESIEKRKPEKMGHLNDVGQGKLKQLFPPGGKSVVVVESVTKAKIIQGYLGDTFEVLPSYGHVRDLAARSGSVRPDDDFSMVWEVPATAWTHLKSIKVALSGAENLILASDPDREGEAIAWHIIEMLKQQDALSQDISVARVVFHEITEASIKSALQAPRRIDVNLVHAYLARRALDYLIGFNISPLLWRKLPGCRSAGRVQSAALSLICDREMEIDDFKPQEYWTIEAELSRKELDCAVNANLTHVDSKKLNQLSISSHTEAKDIQKKIESVNFQVVGTKKSKVRKNPPTPYITSTLQQDAANKLLFGSTYTMKLAQKLYEGIQLADGKATGLITYHRTDGLHVSDEAVQDIRSIVIERYGPDFASSGARKYFKKVKNAQEAHEAIRPTNIRVLPSMLVEVLDEDSLKLYTLIWSRTMACQMEPATFEQIVVEIGDAAKSLAFRSACLRVEFLGYQAVYEDAEAGTIRSEENEAYDRHKSFEILKNLKLGEPLNLGEMELKQHFTQPPSRYSEGSLVKKLEELGIGRPSTYASTLKVLQDRNYVTVKNRVLHPEFRGRMVSAFLSHHFTEVTDYSFTADMETELDNVSAGLTEWKGLLSDYWTRFSSHCKKAENIHVHQVEKMLEKTFGAMLFGSLPHNNRTCPSCMEGTLIFKVSRYGAGYFIGCDQHPRCRYIAKSLYGEEEDDDDIPQIKHPVEEPKLLGFHPVSNEKILLKSGPYGFYVQLGEDRKGYAPKRASVSHFKDMDAITLENAVEWLRYPVTLGNHPKDGQPVTIKLGNIGFSIRHRRSIASVPKNMKPEDITMDKALKLLSGNKVRQCGRPKGKPKLEEALEAM